MVITQNYVLIGQICIVLGLMFLGISIVGIYLYAKTEKTK
jgi:hypothetical protein